MGTPVGLDRQQEVCELILIQLQHVGGHAEAVLPRVSVQDGEQLVDAPRGDPWPSLVAVNCVRLAAARLAVGENADVVAIHRGLNQVLGVRKHLPRQARRFDTSSGQSLCPKV